MNKHKRNNLLCQFFQDLFWSFPKQVLKIFLTIFILVFICWGCKKTTIVEPIEETESIFQSNDFPFTLNSYWMYKRIDNLSHNTDKDTIIARVIAKDVTIANIKHLWKLVWNDIDTQYVSYSDTQIIFYRYIHSLNKLEVESQYNFPIKVNDEWYTTNENDIYTVLHDDAPSSHFGLDFGECYYLSRTKIEDNGYNLHDKILLKKGIGIIYRNISERRGIPFRNDLLRLIDYKIN